MYHILHSLQRQTLYLTIQIQTRIQKTKTISYQHTATALLISTLFTNQKRNQLKLYLQACAPNGEARSSPLDSGL